MFRINLHIYDMLQRGQIMEKTCYYLVNNIDRTHQFYMLPKIHKGLPKPPGRPIASGSESPTKIFQFVDHFINTLVPKI